MPRWRPYDGVGWVTASSNVNSGFNPTVAYIGIRAEANGVTNHWQCAVDWIRVNGGL